MAEPLTLTNRALALLCRGLASLDAVREGENHLIGFEFERPVKWKLVLASVAADAGKLAIDRADRALCQTLGVHDGMEATPANADKLAAYAHEIEELRDLEVTIPDMPRFLLSELLDRPASDDKKARKVNPISQSTLRNLAPILEEK